jgi:hypothetical protein
VIPPLTRKDIDGVTRTEIESLRWVLKYSPVLANLEIPNIYNASTRYSYLDIRDILPDDVKKIKFVLSEMGYDPREDVVELNDGKDDLLVDMLIIPMKGYYWRDKYLVKEPIYERDVNTGIILKFIDLLKKMIEKFDEEVIRGGYAFTRGFILLEERTLDVFKEIFETSKRGTIATNKAQLPALYDNINKMRFVSLVLYLKSIKYEKSIVLSTRTVTKSGNFLYYCNIIYSINFDSFNDLVTLLDEESDYKIQFSQYGSRWLFVEDPVKILGKSDLDIKFV